KPNATPEQKKKLWADATRRSQRQKAVLFLDATYTVPCKGLSVLRAGFLAAARDAEKKGRKAAAKQNLRALKVLDEAAWVGADAALEYLVDHAARSTRAGAQGKRRIGMNGITVARFMQFDNRNGEPNTHIHQAILVRGLCEDGQWRSIDSNLFFSARPGASAVGDRAAMEYLTRKLGLQFTKRADGNGWELVGLSQKGIDAFSSRRVRITRRVETLI